MPTKDRYKNKYTPECCDELVKLMSKGLTDHQIAARLGISYTMFRKWKDTKEEFKEAYELGDPKRFDYLMTQGDEVFLTGANGPNDKGYKHWQKKMSFIYKHYSPEGIGGQVTNNVQINNFQEYQSKSNQELLEILQTKLQNLKTPETMQLIDARIVDDPESN